MAYVPAIGDLLIVKHAAFCVNQVAINTLFYQVTGVTGGGVSDLLLAQGIDNDVAGPYKALIGNDAVYYGTYLARHSPGPVTTPAVGKLNSGNGTTATPSLPGQVTGIIRGTCQFSGPKYRARIYTPFPAAAGNDAAFNHPTAAYVVDLDALRLQVFTPYTIAGGGASTTVIPVVYHRASHLTDNIIDSSSGVKWATQKRRGNYGRQNTFPPF